MIRCTEQLVGEEQQYKPGLLSLGTGTTDRAELHSIMSGIET